MKTKNDSNTEINQALDRICEFVVNSTLPQYKKLISSIASGILEKELEYAYFAALSRSMKVAWEKATTNTSSQLFQNTIIRLSHHIPESAIFIKRLTSSVEECLYMMQKSQNQVFFDTATSAMPKTIYTRENIGLHQKTEPSNTGKHEQEFISDIRFLNTSSPSNWQQCVVRDYQKWADRNPIYAQIFRFLMEISIGIISGLIVFCCTNTSEYEEDTDAKRIEPSVTYTICQDSTVIMDSRSLYYFDISINNSNDNITGNEGYD